MSLYFAPVALLVFLCSPIESEDSKGNYTQVTTTNYKNLHYDGIVEFGKGDNKDITIKLTTATKGKTTGLAVSLTAGKVLSFNVAYGVKPTCLNTTTAQFHFGEQYGAWTAGSQYFRVLMMQGTVDPVVPFEVGKDLQITVDPNSGVLTVKCGPEHNRVKGSVMGTDGTVNGSTLYTPELYLDYWKEQNSKQCTIPPAQQYVNITLHNAEVWTKAGGTPPTPAKDLETLTIAFPVSKPEADKKVKSLLTELAQQWTKQLNNKTLAVSLIPYKDAPVAGNFGPCLDTKTLKAAINKAFGQPNNGTRQKPPSQASAVKAYAKRQLAANDYFFLIAPGANQYSDGAKARKADAQSAAKDLATMVRHIGKAAVGGPNLRRSEFAEYSNKGQPIAGLENLGQAEAAKIVRYFTG